MGLVTGDNWQYDHGGDSHKTMTGDNWQNDHGDDSQCRETGSCCNRRSERLGPKAKLLMYEVVQGGRHEKRLLLHESIKRTKKFKCSTESTVSLSTTKAETYAGVTYVQDIRYMKNVLESLRLRVKLPVIL